MATIVCLNKQAPYEPMESTERQSKEGEMEGEDCEQTTQNNHLSLSLSLCVCVCVCVCLCVCVCVCVCFVEGEVENRSVGFMLGWFSICSTLLIYSRCHFSFIPYKIYLSAMSNGLGSSNDALYSLLSCCLRDTVVLYCGQHSGLTLRRLMSYIYRAPILDVSRSHTTTQHSR